MPTNNTVKGELVNEQDILEKAIRKAQAKGFTAFPITASEYNADIFTAAVLGMIKSKKVNNLIFNRDFAEALWRYEKPVYLPGAELQTLEAWQYHLQQMVIADNRLKYLGDHYADK